MNLTQRYRALIAEVGRGDPGQLAEMTPLAGGVSSDIARFTLGGRAAVARFGERARQRPQVLIHGDVNPKNILLRAGVPVPLDAEVASLGDAAFDVAFCINHLLLKIIHRPAAAGDLRAAAAAFWAAYRAHVDWEAPAELEVRVCALLPALLLAHVDGKSPVEYLSAAGQSRARALALVLASPPPTLAALAGTGAVRAEQTKRAP